MNTNKFCKVTNCRFSHSHTTKSHLCGKCKIYGHGEVECRNTYAINNLKKYWTDKLPDNLKCTFTNCRFSEYHTSDAHHCPLCFGRAHTVDTCPTMSNGASSSTVKTTSKMLEIKCPLCKVVSTLHKDQPKVYGTSDTCVVCMSNSAQVFLPKCGHVCICPECSITLNTNPLSSVSGTEDFSDMIRGEYILTRQGYDLELIKSWLRDYPSFITVYEGLGSCSYIRRHDVNSELEALFYHADDHMSPHKTSKLNNFIRGYAYIKTPMFSHEWGTFN